MYHDDDLEAHVEDELRSERRQCRDKRGRFRSNHCWHTFEDGSVACCNCHAVTAEQPAGGRGQA